MKTYKVMIMMNIYNYGDEFILKNSYGDVNWINFGCYSN